jgi:O-antigen/teichoic acid export membrane protein
MDKKLRINVFFNFLKTAFTVLFPLITFPYISRVLGPQGLGTSNFVSSFLSYFKLIAALGINTYAISYGSKIRNDKIKFKLFASEIFSLNLFSTIGSFFLFLLTILFFDIKNYDNLLLIESLSLLLSPFGVLWLFNIIEDFRFITLRYIILQLVSIFLILIFVKDPEDLYIYIFILVFGSNGTNIINFIFAKKIVGLQLKFDFLFILKKHIKQVLILFAISLTTSLYLNNDILLLGLMTTETEIGLYVAPLRIIRLFVLLVSFANSVLIPRLSFYFEKKELGSVKKILSYSISSMLLIIIPIFVVLLIYPYEILVILVGNQYLTSTVLIQILSFNLFFSTFSGFFVYSVLIPQKKEKDVIIITFLAAILNLLLNFILIFFYGNLGASFVNIFTEFIVLIPAIVLTYKFLDYQNIFKNFLQFTFSSSVFFIIKIFLFEVFGFGLLFNFFLLLVISFCFYGLILLVLQNQLFMNITQNILGFIFQFFKALKLKRK